MAQFGGNKNQPPWLGGGSGNPHGHGRPEHLQPGLMGFGGPHGGPPGGHGGPPGQASIHQAGPPVFAAQPGHHPGIHGPPGLSLVHGPHTPATVAALAGQQVIRLDLKMDLTFNHDRHIWGLQISVSSKLPQILSTWLYHDSSVNFRE